MVAHGMKPYRPKGRYYVITAHQQYPNGSLFHNKAQVGARYTAARLGTKQGAHQTRSDAMSLILYGTCDTLARGNKMKAYRSEHYRPVTVYRKVS